MSQGWKILARWAVNQPAELQMLEAKGFLVLYSTLINQQDQEINALAENTNQGMSEQEQLVACSECHREATPELYTEWYESLHGVAMVKCYQCHGTFETFRVTPTRQDCAACHENMLAKCPQDKPCWQCHIPHGFKVRK